VESRVTIITRGGGGIGRATALLCARRGDKIAVLDKDAAAAARTSEEAMHCGSPLALGLASDVSSETQVARAFAESESRLGPCYGVFANAGMDVGGFIHELAIETWQQVISTKLTGVFLTCKHALRQMLAAQIAGSIVCASSPCGLVALAAGGVGAYSATKGGISALSRCMAVDYARSGIRVNAIAPGATETGMMWNHVPADEIAGMRTQVNSEIPLGRIAQPDEPARAVLWLLSDESAYVTGSHLVCDGGILAKASISI
jgi:NAD(P)-dependent dehydrogenase (short-subunit alcohol dehydrogenase family)